MLEEKSPLKKLNPSNDSSKKSKINLAKVGGEDLYRVAWCDGEHEPEEDPEEWREADEAEEKRLQKAQVLERPEGSAEGISYLTARSVYDWKKKPCHHGGGTTSKRWQRRSRLVARDFSFAEGKRDDILSPATSGHVALKLLPAIFLQRVSEEEEAGEGEGAFSQALGWFDVKDAFLQVPQENPLKVNLRGEEFSVKRWLPGQRVGAKSMVRLLYRVPHRGTQATVQCCVSMPRKK